MFDESISNDGISRRKETEELWAAATELLLEYLRFTSPPILDKKDDDTFESSNNSISSV